ncbi:hypothetical protein DFQ28_008488 [Apophysomyces sp. BC1034]|nr:hypothetical protein DFQ28_008488 [Apophysomyces sp. BC1034]
MLNIEIYRKTLRRMDTAISSKHWSDDRSSIYAAEAGGAQESSTGTIVNLMSTDSTRITDFCRMWYNVVSAPVELLVGVLFLYQLLGVSCLLGLMVLVITLPINHYTAKLFARTNNRIMEARDKRVNLINEVLQGIRQIKFFAWEKSWEKRIMEARNVELGHLRMGYMCEALFQWLWQGTPILVTIASFWSFTKLEGNELSAPIAFTAIAIFTELRFALNAVPEVFIELLQALISVRRIETYLREDEIIQPPPIDPKDPIRIGFSDATIGWKKTSLDENGNVSDHSSFVLKDVSVQFPNGELSLICGATGSGKTLMILSLLGEAVILRGQVFFPRTAVADSVPDELTIPSNILVKDWLLDHAVAYVSQTAWLQHASIRDNILFGLPYIKERYQATLTACTLDQDLAIFEDGDATEIGERGITLSGGQKARVSLARAVYSRARTVLMDDVLGAVDAHTAKHLFSKCLTGPLMSGRTRILITHHVRLCLDDSAYIVHVRDGRVDIAGNLSEVRQSDALISILGSEDENEDISSDEEYGSGYTKQPYVTNEIYVEADTTTSPPRILIEEEGRSTGSVSRRVYQTYMGVVGGAFFWLLMAILVFGSRGMDIAESWWIKKWAQSYPRPENNSTAADPSYMMSAMPDSFQSFDVTRTLGTVNNVDFYLKIYICIALANTVIGTSRFAVLYVGVLRASKILYIQLLRRVFRAPLRFFDSIPIGRVLNRFAKDFETVDSTIPNVTLNFVAQALVVLSSILTVSFVLPIFLIPMMLVAICNIAFGVLFLAGTVEMKRLDSVTKSPLFSHFTETIAGVTTIRAFGATRMFLQDMLKRIDTNSRPFYYTWLTSRWVSIRYSVTGAAINMTIATIILFNLDRMDVAQAGFCLSFVLLYSNQMSDAVKQYTSMEVNFNAVERVVEFLDVEQEAPAITDLKPPANWPTKGCIEVQNLEVRYTADLEPVLRDMTFSVNAREKIGVVGRTGSGKSTLALSFFRFLEASKGKITIDGVDIKDIGTEDLRRNLTIIPQDPIMFTGTLRSNVDPFDRFSDDEIFIALRCVHLLPSTEDDDAEFLGENTNIFQNLESPVSEGGKNFSQGQRQLLCLARALLKRDRIVWMDEATASVDFPTDKAIQKTIATEFADCTILCIAHRLHTVIEYDRIMVLDRGQLVEFSSPLELITDPSSLFYSMCRNSGEFDSLLALAKGKHQLVDVDVDV